MVEYPGCNNFFKCPIFPDSCPDQAWSCDHSHDPEQFGPEGGPVPSRAGHLRRERAGIFKLGTVLDGPTLSFGNGRPPDVGHVLWTSHGSLSKQSGQSKMHCHKRDGHSQLFF